MKFLTLAAIAMIGASAAPAFATDFTFDVPLTIENVPSGQSATIQCYVSTLAAANINGSAATGNVVGRGEKTVTLVNGAFHGTVSVEFNATAPGTAANGKSFGCSLNVMGKPVNGVSWATSPDNAQMVYEKATNLKVERVATHAYGTLP